MKDQEKENKELFDEISFQGIPMIIKRGNRNVLMDIRDAGEAIKHGLDWDIAESVFSSRPGRSCHLIYSRKRWSGFVCEDDTCEGDKKCVLHVYDWAVKDWKVAVSPGTDEDALYNCFCV